VKRLRRLGIGLGLVSLLATATLTAVGSGVASASKSPIIIGYISDLTGVASSTFADGVGGAQARIDLQNAHGGVNGHPLKLVSEDDQSSPTVNNTAGQDLVTNKGAFGIIDFSALAFGGTKYLQQQGIPVVGGGFDGPEWDQQPNTNMFSWDPLVDEPIGSPPVYYGSTAFADILKGIGGTKAAGFAYSISQSSQQSIRVVFGGGGVNKCLENFTVPFGGVDFTATALQIKSSGCNAVVGSFVDASDVALAQAVKNAGITAQQVYFTGYDQGVLDSASARAALSGTYEEGAANFSQPNTATKAMLASLTKYDTSYTGGIPDLGLYGSWFSADLMIKGLLLAGANPTRAGFISKLRKVTSYNAEGILPTSVGFTGFGTAGSVPKTICVYFMHLQGKSFTPYKGAVTCGKRIAVSPSL